MRAAALAAGADLCTGGQRCESRVVLRDEDVARIDAFRRCGKNETGGQLGGQVFERVDGKIDGARRRGSFFDLLGEHALRADLGEGDLLQAIAGGFDDLDLYCVALRTRRAGDVVGLPECELRAAATDARRFIGGLPPRWLGCRRDRRLRFSSERVDGISVTEH